MTAETLHTDEHGDRLELSTDGPTVRLRIHSAENDFAAMVVPSHVADALRTALAAGPDAKLADVSKLLVLLEEVRAYELIGTANVREALGLPVPCRADERISDSTRVVCARRAHGTDTPHVDKLRHLCWNTAGGAVSDLMGWDGTDYDAPEQQPMTDEVRRTIGILDRAGAPEHLDAGLTQQFIRENTGLSPVPARLMRLIVATRQARVAEPER